MSEYEQYEPEFVAQFELKLGEWRYVGFEIGRGGGNGRNLAEAALRRAIYRVQQAAAEELTVQFNEQAKAQGLK